jgi:hypothetical protein
MYTRELVSKKIKKGKEKHGSRERNSLKFAFIQQSRAINVRKCRYKAAE